MASVKIIDNDRGLNKLLLRVRKLDGAQVSVGIQGAEASEVREGGITNAEVGTIHEFGAPRAGIPQRSFERSTFDEKRKKYERALEKGAAKIANGSKSTRAVLFELGERARSDMIAKINSNIPPPLKPQTIARKQDDLALVDFGILRGSITSVVKL